MIIIAFMRFRNEDLPMYTELVKYKVANLNLPARFEHKLLFDLEYVLTYNIPDLERIILFGSCARGTMRVTSDLDLLIITTTPLSRLVRGEISSELEDSMDEVRKERYPQIPLQSMECKWLGDFYFDARYPWDNFVVVSKEDAYNALSITEHILKCVDIILENK